ncbi:MAG TPA: amidohydrolase family protein [Chloroflexota bacterium]|jgi:imidazolonepropionase-like amidohydrolase
MHVLKAARLIDGTGAEPVLDGRVHVDGRRIVYAGPARDAPPIVGPTDDVIDLGDRTLLPGLIDCHAHPVSWAASGGDRPGSELSQPWGDQLRVLGSIEKLRKALMAGVTTIRNTGSPRHTAYAVKAALESGAIEGPRLIVAGPAICPTGGHAHGGGGEADSPDGVRLMAREQFKNGAQFLKLTATGGGTFGTVRHRATYTVAELAAAANEADQHDSYATVHVHGTEGIVRCLDAGIQMLEHATFVLQDNREYFDADVAARIRDQNVVVVPTVQVYGRWVETSPGHLDNLTDDEEAEWETHYNALPYQLIAFPHLRKLSAYERGLWEHRYDSFMRRVELVGRLYETGVVLLMGSDGGGRPAPIDDPAHGLECHVTAGIPPLQVIASATGLAAKWIRIDNVTGTLAVGKEADVIAVDGDPVADMRCMEHVDFVMRAGKVVKTPALAPSMASVVSLVS